MQIGNEIKLIDPLKLTSNPINVTIYGEEEPDPSLIESIREQGQLEPIVITEKNIIISGHRRWIALKALKLPTSTCLTISFNDDLEMKEAIIEFNKQRKKSTSQIYNEIKLLKSIISERSEIRRLATLKQNANKDTVVSNSTPREETGKTRDIIGQKLGIGQDKVTKIEKIGDSAAAGDEYAKRELKKADSGEVTVDAAIKTLEIRDIATSNSPVAEKAKVMLDQVERNVITPNQAKKQLKEEKEKVEVQVAKGTKIPKGIFNIILADPPRPFEDILNKKIPADKDAVLFLWSNANSLPDSLELMKYWGFEYKSMSILDKGSSTDTLLFGKRGNGLISYSKLPVIVHEKNRTCIYDLIEKMFPSQRYLEIFRENTRKGWNVGHVPEPEPQPARNEHGALIAIPEKVNMRMVKIKPDHIYNKNEDKYHWLYCEIAIDGKLVKCSVSPFTLKNNFKFVLPNVENLAIDFSDVFKNTTPIISYRPVEEEYFEIKRIFPDEQWNNFVKDRFPYMMIDDEPEEPEESEKPEEKSTSLEPEVLGNEGKTQQNSKFKHTGHTVIPD